MHTLSLQSSALSEKATDVVSSIVSNVEQRCRCGLTSSQIQQGGFQCFPDSEDAVTYRAELHENGRATVSELVRFIEDWITEDGGVGILTQSLFVTIDGSCDVMIMSRVETECQPQPVHVSTTTRVSTTIRVSTTTRTEVSPNEPVASGGPDTGAIVGGAIVVVLILAITITAIVALVLRSRRDALKLQEPPRRYVQRFACIN